MRFDPSALFLLDHSEYQLYRIDEELRASPSDTRFIIPILADIKDAEGMRKLFEKYRPELVFHAAAYKHVHLVECNPFSAILNNVKGTLNLLDLCEEFDVQRFVLISTDKAVRPAGIMGATKRICELLASERGQRIGKTFCSVRFGNVLGSSGSLIPQVEEQIRLGKPVTVTHKDMRRYFMLIHEAVLLVLKAAAIAKPGDIMILKMGDPVLIVDIIKRMIALMGKSEDEVHIVFTGIRPGEKIFEELYLCGNEVQTNDPDILVVPCGDRNQTRKHIPSDLIHRTLEICRLAQSHMDEAVRLLYTMLASEMEHTQSFFQFENPADRNQPRRGSEISTNPP